MELTPTKLWNVAQTNNSRQEEQRPHPVDQYDDLFKTPEVSESDELDYQGYSVDQVKRVMESLTSRGFTPQTIETFIAQVYAYDPKGEEAKPGNCDQRQYWMSDREAPLPDRIDPTVVELFRKLFADHGIIHPDAGIENWLQTSKLLDEYPSGELFEHEILRRIPADRLRTGYFRNPSIYRSRPSDGSVFTFIEEIEEIEPEKAEKRPKRRRRNRKRHGKLNGDSHNSQYYLNGTTYYDSFVQLPQRENHQNSTSTRLPTDFYWPVTPVGGVVYLPLTAQPVPERMTYVDMLKSYR